MTFRDLSPASPCWSPGRSAAGQHLLLFLATLSGTVLFTLRTFGTFSHSSELLSKETEFGLSGQRQSPRLTSPMDSVREPSSLPQMPTVLFVGASGGSGQAQGGQGRGAPPPPPPVPSHWKYFKGCQREEMVALASWASQRRKRETLPVGGSRCLSLIPRSPLNCGSAPPIVDRCLCLDFTVCVQMSVSSLPSPAPPPRP